MLQCTAVKDFVLIFFAWHMFLEFFSAECFWIFFLCKVFLGTHFLPKLPASSFVQTTTTTVLLHLLAACALKFTDLAWNETNTIYDSLIWPVESWNYIVRLHAITYSFYSRELWCFICLKVIILFCPNTRAILSQFLSPYLSPLSLTWIHLSVTISWKLCLAQIYPGQPCGRCVRAKNISSYDWRHQFCRPA